MYYFLFESAKIGIFHEKQNLRLAKIILRLGKIIFSRSKRGKCKPQKIFCKPHFWNRGKRSAQNAIGYANKGYVHPLHTLQTEDHGGHVYGKLPCGGVGRSRCTHPHIP